MPPYLSLAVLALGSVASLTAQTGCSTGALSGAATKVAAIRHDLHDDAVGHSDPNVPPAIALKLAALKSSLTLAADAVFTCSPAAATPEQLQHQLADALHANVAPAAEQAIVDTKSRKDIGAYGSDLAVQVFQLFGKPKFYEVDFRFGIECGDDNLLLVYEAGNKAGNDSGTAWQKRLRWDAPDYKTVSDAIGDFVMLTPLTGSYDHPSWRFVVAHGHPACGATPRTSRFDLELLSPTADPANPTMDWHFEHAYLHHSNTAPRLATTEDTIDFQITTAPAPLSKSAAAAAKPEVYRFHLNAAGKIEPSNATMQDESSTKPQAKAPTTTSSPQ